ncbi:hypothetical protein HaLaN_20744 [Haematococcus lacustris]|uniref:Uncharacterized protein n=1 Tax=Haematococcus lacustris TaxID=44745 RepID=A0A699ZLS2_HAELA|nr:hypothetical protein HaLaN_20744 [Haematococcus lacustris]
MRLKRWAWVSSQATGVLVTASSYYGINNPHSNTHAMKEAGVQRMDLTYAARDTVQPHGNVRPVWWVMDQEGCLGVHDGQVYVVAFELLDGHWLAMGASYMQFNQEGHEINTCKRRARRVARQEGLPGKGLL